ncbi:MAG: hypothetical protein HC822_19070 [Oscillochloris sp.]|nr:hypothetical protein [Oscillochloris sp.]
MREQRHIIKRQLIELTVQNPAQAQRLYDEVGRIWRQRIVPLLDRQCSELSASGRLYRIERLELDVGALDPDHLEADLVTRVSAALGPALRAQLAAQNQPDEPDGITAQLELLALFARSGSLPWWADAATPALLDNAVHAVFSQKPEQLRLLLRELASAQRPLQRLAGHLSATSLALLAASLGMPALAPELTALIALLQQTSFNRRGPATIERIVWATALQVLAPSGQGEIAPEVLLQAVLRQIAIESGTPYADLLAALGPIAQATPLPNAPALLVLLAPPQKDRPAEKPATAQESAPESQQPTPRSTGRSDRSDLASAQNSAAGERTAPSQRGSISRPGISARGPAGANQHPARPGPRDLRFSEADEIAIDNAGLVILWPFLSNFFARLDLLAGRRFKDNAARQRAVGLLQYSATGSTTWPEYLLPLNKLLCGLELDEVFDFGAPLSEAEATECTDLLTAVIAQAPILRSMAPDGLRGTFLLRRAMLSSRDGAWLLRVERQTYDLVLDRFPWGWSWLKLPWMQAPLRVEW